MNTLYSTTPCHPINPNTDLKLNEQMMQDMKPENPDFSSGSATPQLHDLAQVPLCLAVFFPKVRMGQDLPLK